MAMAMLETKPDFLEMEVEGQRSASMARREPGSKGIVG